MPTTVGMIAPHALFTSLRQSNNELCSSMCLTFLGHEKETTDQTSTLLTWDTLTFKMCGILDIYNARGIEVKKGTGVGVRGRHFTC